MTDIAVVARECEIPDLETIADGERQATGREMIQIARYFETTVQALALSGDLSELHNEPIIVPRRRRAGLEVCEFCGVSYHPMMRWAKGSTLVTVCSPEFYRRRDRDRSDPGCEKKAEELGFERRPDLTPRR